MSNRSSSQLEDAVSMEKIMLPSDYLGDFECYEDFTIKAHKVQKEKGQRQSTEIQNTEDGFYKSQNNENCDNFMAK